jgi:HEAT repeat protein
MARKDRIRQALSELEQLRASPPSPQSVQKLRTSLAHKSSPVVAKAAQIAGEFELAELEDQMVAAFDRYMINPLKSDPGCSAKTALVEALYRIGSHDERLFLTSIHCVQLEPTYGGKQDTAAQVRAYSALGLVRTVYPEIMVELADLLADPELDARIGAVRAISASRQRAGIPLLRFKALVGDNDLRVMRECFRALLELAPDSSISFITRFLESEEDVICETAAISLGESRLDGAFEVLRNWCEQVEDTPMRHSGLTAVALLRNRPAIDYLLSLVANGPVSVARDAVAVLELYKDDRLLWREVEMAISQRSDLDIAPEA